MRDPMTVAFDVRTPWKQRSKLFPEGLGRTILVVWHKDPERDGSDDSCGWSYPKLSKRQIELLKGLAWSEAYEPWFQRLREKRNEDPVQAEHLMRGAVELTCRVLGVRASWGDISRWACRFVHNPTDNFRGGLCHLPGYHTNRDEDSKRWREDCALGLFIGIARQVLADRRPWWRHPKFHVHHWRFQVPFLQDLARFLFSRCEVCGRRFPWGYAPVTASWSSDGPRFFRGEPGVRHQECAAESGR